MVNELYLALLYRPAPGAAAGALSRWLTRAGAAACAARTGRRA